MPVDRERRVRFLAFQYEIDRLSRGLQSRIFQRSFRENGRIARRDQQNISFAHGNRKLFGKVQNHFAAGLRTPRLYKTQMPGRDLGVASKIQLAQAASLPPFAKQIADRARGTHRATMIMQDPATSNFRILGRRFDSRLTAIIRFIAKYHVPIAIPFAAISLAIWLYLALGRGMFWRLSPFDQDATELPSPASWPRVVGIVPARNEAETIARTIAALLKQDYPGEFSVVVVDDHSEDGTAQLAQQAATQNGPQSPFRIHTASPLPQGWTGKLWALDEGVRHTAPFPNCRTASLSELQTASSPKSSSRAERGIRFSSVDEVPTTNAPDTNPSYFWFTDADVVHAPDTLRRLVSRAEQSQLDLTSLMVLLQAKTLPERALIPPFLYFFLKLYPPRWIADPNARTAGAAGGCVLLRPDALERIGGLAAIRSEVIDDCALARTVKRSGGEIWMGLTRTSVSLRAYKTFAEIRDMIARTAFTQLRYSPLLLLGTLVGMFLTYLAPIALLFASNNPVTQILSLAAWFLMSLTFLPTVRFYRLSPLWAPLLPFAALFYAYATWLSAIRYWLKRGAQWKGRAQAPRQT